MHIAAMFFQMTVFSLLWISGVQVQDNLLPHDPKDLVLDSGFALPETNAFGHTFRHISNSFAYYYDENKKSWTLIQTLCQGLWCWIWEEEGRRRVLQDEPHSPNLRVPVELVQYMLYENDIWLMSMCTGSENERGVWQVEHSGDEYLGMLWAAEWVCGREWSWPWWATDRVADCRSNQEGLS